MLVRAGLDTLLVDLLTPEEEAEDVVTGRLRFDIPLLADRVVGTIDWLALDAGVATLPLRCRIYPWAASAQAPGQQRPSSRRSSVRIASARWSLAAVEEPGALDRVEELTRDWFMRHLAR